MKILIMIAVSGRKLGSWKIERAEAKLLSYASAPTKSRSARLGTHAKSKRHSLSTMSEIVRQGTSRQMEDLSAHIRSEEVTNALKRVAER